MDDSNDTTTPPSVTRRKLLAGTVMATAALPLRAGTLPAAELARNSAVDPVLSLWQAWRAAHRRTLAACRRQQRLECGLVNRVGFPCAMVYLSDEDVTITVYGPEQIEELFGDDPCRAATRAKAEADLAAHQARWDAADSELGYAVAKQAEQEAADHAQELFDALTHTPAASLAGIAGKLDALLCEGESAEDCADFPWPHIRSALADLVRLAQTLQPGTFMPGGERSNPCLRGHRIRAGAERQP